MLNSKFISLTLIQSDPSNNIYDGKGKTASSLTLNLLKILKKIPITLPTNTGLKRVSHWTYSYLAQHVDHFDWLLGKVINAQQDFTRWAKQLTVKKKIVLVQQKVK